MAITVVPTGFEGFGDALSQGILTGAALKQKQQEIDLQKKQADQANKLLALSLRSAGYNIDGTPIIPETQEDAKKLVQQSALKQTGLVPPALAPQSAVDYFSSQTSNPYAINRTPEAFRQFISGGSSSPQTLGLPVERQVNPMMSGTPVPVGLPKININTRGGISTSFGGDQSYTRGIKEDQWKSKMIQAMGNDLDPTKGVRSQYAVAAANVARAERIEGLVNRYKDFNLTKQETEELAIGLNSLLQGSNQSAQEQVKSLMPRTIVGDIAKMTEYLFNTPQGLNQQKIVERMYQNSLREKQVGKNQLYKYATQKLSKYSDLRKKYPEEWADIARSYGIDPAEYDAWKSAGYKELDPSDVENFRGNSSLSEMSTEDLFKKLTGK